MAVRFVKAGTELRVFMDGRWRHMIATEVTDQDTAIARLGRREPVAVARIAGTHRFEAVEAGP